MTEWNWTKGELAEGLRCYQTERFFDAHEHWEGVWSDLQGQERSFLQALIQLTVAFHHSRRGNQRGMRSMLQRSLEKLEACPDSFGGISVAPLRNEIRECLRQLNDAEGPLPSRSPQITIK